MCNLVAGLFVRGSTPSMGKGNITKQCTLLYKVSKLSASGLIGNCKISYQFLAWFKVTLL